eukprot:CAMPEP_0113873588 /NCGR_PEP_ID=MMETSP0780_2-20120614/3854_1 /TAXON_ID=652834 /ORGANISM="Palpitomonas bilix" /LENGTH=376 /DNA_ID=CAMNT_0000859251 /DNA_START=91 /DNA_END=1218 /DNA_ORIENTATION=- /assembly_acc=CAM_ASM_000599
MRSAIVGKKGDGLGVTVSNHAWKEWANVGEKGRCKCSIVAGRVSPSRPLLLSHSEEEGTQIRGEISKGDGRQVAVGEDFLVTSSPCLPTRPAVYQYAYCEEGRKLIPAKLTCELCPPSFTTLRHDDVECTPCPASTLVDDGRASFTHLCRIECNAGLFGPNCLSCAELFGQSATSPSSPSSTSSTFTSTSSTLASVSASSPSTSTSFSSSSTFTSTSTPSPSTPASTSPPPRTQSEVDRTGLTQAELNSLLISPAPPTSHLHWYFDKNRGKCGWRCEDAYYLSSPSSSSSPSSPSSPLSSLPRRGGGVTKRSGEERGEETRQNQTGGSMHEYAGRGGRKEVERGGERGGEEGEERRKAHINMEDTRQCVACNSGEW